MINELRLLGIAGATAALVASSHAAITFSNFSDALVGQVAPNAVKYNPNIATLGPDLNTLTGGFTAASAAGLTSVQVNLGSNYLYGSNALAFSAQVKNNTTNAVTIIYSDSLFGSGLTGQGLLLNGPLTAISGTSFDVTYKLSYAAITVNDAAAFSDATFTFGEAPVPEPASMVALTCGLVGLVSRRRKGTK